ncbi:hypothetical protein HPP92_006991 [Vanilla planifolia]|uniref:RNA polymerase sigma factor n=1 Tax=Vanilla planifolia TaxID=51239 RepID=A0A835RPZ0_VANPL|nr:hypothetical protein HPP92_006991 [Vanilla planifolia]
MACLVPQFMCPASSDIPKHFHHTSHSNARILVRFETRCASSQFTAVVEKLQLPTFEAYTSLTCMRPLTYLGGNGPPEKKNVELKLPIETILTSEEAVIAAAAAEAISLAKSAAEFAKAAAELLGNSPCDKSNRPSSCASGKESLRAEIVKKIECGQISWDKIKTIPHIGHIQGNQSQRSCVSVLHSVLHSDEFDILQKVAVRSMRHMQRRVRRESVAEKATKKVVTVKSCSSGKKKREAVKEIDFSDPLRCLRRTTSTTKLLTASEEQQLSRGIQDMLKLQRVQSELTERTGNPPTFAQWAAAAELDKRTLRKLLNHGKQCKEKMVKSNIRLVISIAKNFVGAGMSIQDLVQEGCRGLIKCAEKFDASKGFRFSTYAHWWIRQAVKKSLTDQSRTIRLPSHVVESCYRVRRVRKQLYSEKGRHPNDEEVAEAAGLSMRRLRTVLLTPKPPISLDQKIGFNQSLKPSEVVADPDAVITEERLMRQFLKVDLNKAFDILHPREKQVVLSRFGLLDGRMKTLQEIGTVMGVSRERIRQIESCAIRKLKRRKKIKNLRHYLLK